MCPRASLQALPQAVIERIKKDEYVNFDHLLPSTVTSADDFNLNVSGGSIPSVTLVQLPSGE